MATSTTSTSVTPAATIVSTTESWLKSHERIVCLFLILLVAGYGLNRYFDYSAAKADARAVAAEQVAADAKANAAALASQSAVQAQQYQALVTALATQNASLAQSIASRQAALPVQQATDARLPLTDLATRLQTMGNAPVGSVSVIGDKIDLTQLGAVAVTQTLEQVPILSGNLADEIKIAQNKQQELEKSDLLAAGLDAQIVGLNTQLSDQTKACTAQVAAVKADGKKNSAKWFKRGFIVGFVSGLWGHAAGL